MGIFIAWQERQVIMGRSDLIKKISDLIGDVGFEIERLDSKQVRTREEMEERVRLNSAWSYLLLAREQAIVPKEDLGPLEYLCVSCGGGSGVHSCAPKHPARSELYPNERYGHSLDQEEKTLKNK